MNSWTPADENEELFIQRRYDDTALVLFEVILENNSTYRAQVGIGSYYEI
jgi:hypothetical protein